ncbi:hypothetical protein NDN08_000272 [Rhodosorus marinus]|uniref:Integrase catalytic domain-containing protein n=1 Tax=Rhodosorus marinus TaxID=101924 RepID=A0AAV8UER9_9RHOD|nr:hypothetical protein NDN08_000272 [Rhodosorus marinus]
MTAGKGYFQELMKIDPVRIRTASGAERVAEEAGSVQAIIKGVKYEIQDVLFAPWAAGNILSVRTLTQKGYEVRFNPNVAIHGADGGRLVIQGTLDGRIRIRGVPEDGYGYIVEKENPQKRSSNYNKFMSWHRKLGHAGKDALRRMFNAGVLPATDMTRGEVCNDCRVARMVHEPHARVTFQRTREAGELWHTDLCGPFPDKYVGGKRYFLLVTDDYTGYRWIRFLERKSEAVSEIASLIRQFRTQLYKKVRRLRTDNGGEFGNRDMQKLVDREGIAHERTPPRTPQANGLAERRQPHRAGSRENGAGLTGATRRTLGGTC